MTKDDIIKLAREAGLVRTGNKWIEPARWGVTEVERFAALVGAAERNILAAWMIQRGYATGHGDTIEDLIKELEWQVAEREREACAALVDANAMACHSTVLGSLLQSNADAIRARGNA